MYKADTALLLTERIGFNNPIYQLIKRQTVISDENFDQFKLSKQLEKQINGINNYFSNFIQTTVRCSGKTSSFSISSDKKLYYAIEDRLLSYDIKSKETKFEETLEKGKISSIACVPDSESVILGFTSGLILFLKSPVRSQNFEQIAHEGEVKKIVISDTSIFASCGVDGFIILWRLVEGKVKKISSYKSEGNVLAIDIDTKSKYIVSGGTDREVSIYSIFQDFVIEKISSEKFSDITCVKISKRRKFLVIGDSEGNVFCYSFMDWLFFWSSQKHSGRINCIEIDESDQCIISGGNDSKIIFWSTDHKKVEPVEVSDPAGPINDMKIESKQKLYTISNDKKIKTWGIPMLSQSYIIDLQKYSENCLEIYALGNKDRFYYLLQPFGIIKLDRNGKKESKLKITQEKKVFAYDKTFDRFCVATTENYEKGKKAFYDFTVYSGENLSYIKNLKKKCQGVYSMIYSNDGKHLIIGEYNKFKIREIESFTVVSKYSLNKNSVKYISQSSSMKYLAVATKRSKKITLFELHKRGSDQLEVVHIYEDRIFNYTKKIVFSLDEEFIIVLSEQQGITVWSVLKNLKVITAAYEDVQDIHFIQIQDDKNFLYLIRQSKFECLSFPSFSSNYTISLQESILKYSFSPEDKEIVFLTKSGLEIWTNPGNTEKYSIFGNRKDLYKFCEYVGDIISKQTFEYKEEFNSWIIEPFHMNVLHLFCSFNRSENLKHALKNKNYFFPSRRGYTPLDIALDSNLENCICVIKKYFSSTIKENPFISSLLSSSLNRIINDASAMSKEFLEMIFVETLDEDHPLHSKYKLPLILHSDSFLINNTQEESFFLSEESSLEYLQSYFKLNLRTGSSDSITFLKFLYYTKNENTFNTMFVQTILGYKWMKVKKYLFLQGYVYLSFLLFLSLFSVHNVFWLLSVALIFNIFLVIYEVIQFNSSKVDYLIDPWNYIDLVRSGLTFAIFIQAATGRENSDDLVGSLMIVSLVRGLLCFRLFRQTRYFVRLISRVIKDIIPFLFIMLYSCVSFSLIFHRLGRREYTYSQYLAWSWEMNLSFFDSSNYSQYLYFSFTIYILLNTIILLNLLVAIMCDTFSKVSSSVIIAEGEELCAMILEAETIMSWNRNHTKLQYLHVCRSIEIPHQDEIKNQRAKIKRMETTLHDLSANIKKSSKKIKQIEDNNSNMSQTLSKLGTKLKKIKENTSKSHNRTSSTLSEIKDLIISSNQNISS